MIVVNKANYGENTYIISVGTGLAWTEQYQVAAYNEGEAADIVADHLERTKATGLYYNHAELEAMASCSEWKTAEAFAEAHDLVCCGNHGIYMNIVDIKEVCA